MRYYSLLFGIGVLGAYYFGKSVARLYNISSESMYSLLTYVFLGIFLGARLGHCIFYDFDHYGFNLLKMLSPFSYTAEYGLIFTGYQGLASHGGVIGVIVATVIFCRVNKFSIWAILDIIASVGPFTGAMIRLGNLFNSEIIGNVTDVPWAFVFEKIDHHPRHPTQLYEAIFYLLTFICVYRYSLQAHGKHQSGFIFGCTILIVFLYRFIIELLKIDQVPFEQNMLLNMGQILSIPLITAGVIIVVKKYR